MRIKKIGFSEKPTKAIRRNPMIVTIITHRCPKCGITNMVRNGHDYKGAQKYHCKACDAYGTLGSRAGYNKAEQDQVKRALLERVSLRGLERVFSLSRRTVARWLGKWAEALPDLAQTLADARLDDVLELDELWSFVYTKANQRWI
jgi:transposase-like protein